MNRLIHWFRNVAYVLGAWLRFFVFGIAASAALPAMSVAQDLSTICEQAAAEAAVRSGVPISVLKAISLVETGRNSGGTLRPWPWTVNMEGEGLWFDSREDAQAYVDEHLARGAESFDVGCFQINYKWHHEAFSSVEQMFDPMSNALYAANFLNELFSEKGDWTAAAGAYHSRTQEYADRYSAKFAELRAQLIEEDNRPIVLTGAPIIAADTPVAVVEPVRPRVNTYPLLQGASGGNSSSAMGSLVPLGGATGTNLFARPDAG